MIWAPFLAVMATVASAEAPPLPTGITGQLPPGHSVLASVKLTDGKTGRSFQIVALGRSDEDAQRQRSGEAPVRPLLVFERRGGQFVAAGRNDHVVMRADEGGQCDPFLDGDATIAVKGRYFTVENGVACGQHWTDNITFRLDDRLGFVFDNERVESWSMNPSNAPDAEALVKDGPQQVVRDKPGHVTPFATWRPAR
jgi:hypothetical protein